MGMGLNFGLRLGNQKRNVFDPTLYTWVGADTVGTRDGTFEKPYETLMAAENANPTLTGTKATIYVKAGTYAETFIFSKAYTWIAYGAVTLNRSSGNEVIALRTSGIWRMDGFTISGTSGETSRARIIWLGESNVDCSNKTFVNCNFIEPAATGTFMTDVVAGSGQNTNILFSGCTFTGRSAYICTIQKTASSMTFDQCTFAHVPNNLATNWGFNVVAGTSEGGLVDLRITNCIYAVTGRVMVMQKKGSYTLTGNRFTHIADFTENASIIQMASALGNSATEGQAIDTNTFTFNDNVIDCGTYAYGTTGYGWIRAFGTATSYMNIIAKRNTLTTNNPATLGGFIATDNMLSYDVTDNVINQLATMKTKTGSPATYPAWRGLIDVSGSAKAITTANIMYNTIYALNVRGCYVIKWGEDTTPVGGYSSNLNGAKIYGNLIVMGENDDEDASHVIFCGYCKDNEIYYNKVIGGGSIGIKSEGSEGNYETGGVRYNIFKNMNVGLVAEGVSVEFANNTIIQTGLMTRQMIMAYANPDYKTYAFTLTLKNNVYIALQHNNKPVLQIQWRAGESDAKPLIVSDRNAYGTTGNVAQESNGSTVVTYTFLAWQSAGYDIVSKGEVTFMSTDTGIPTVESNVLGVGTPLNPYKEGLDVASVFPSNIIIKYQDADWDMGAYVL